MESAHEGEQGGAEDPAASDVDVSPIPLVFDEPWPGENPSVISEDASD